MGDISDQMESEYWGREALRADIEDEAYEAKQWPMANGRLIRIEDMEDQHISRTINMIEQKQWRMRWLKLLKAEQRRRTVWPL